MYSFTDLNNECAGEHTSKIWKDTCALSLVSKEEHPRALSERVYIRILTLPIATSPFFMSHLKREKHRVLMVKALDLRPFYFRC